MVYAGSTMARKTAINITIDADLLKRIDDAADKRGDSRSAIIERFCRNEIGQEEEFLHELESPVFRAIYDAMSKRPEIIRAISAVMGEHIDLTAARAKAERLREQTRRGKARQHNKGGEADGVHPKPA